MKMKRKFTEKILAHAEGKDLVKPGELIMADVSIVL